ncbi:MAG: DNA polymerase I [Bacteroidales bacterium]|nr:MAG: DNA polymerase I [Bacteroidales bacterium]
MPKKLLLIDAYASIYRAYFAFINRPIRTSKGLNTSAIYGFTKFMLDAIKRIEPTHIAVAFDLSGPTFRTELFPAYKANRQETPEDIRTAVPIIKRLLTAMNIPIVELKGYEADDIIGALATKADPLGFEVYMFTPDKDYGQLLSPNVKIIKPGKGGGDLETITAESFCADYKINTPSQFIDILALWGDTSDNIPGVKGIGEKTAADLISKFGSIDNILQNTDKLSKAQKINVESSVEQLLLSRTLVTIKTDICLDIDIDTFIRKEPNGVEFKRMLEDLEFKSMLKELPTQKSEKPEPKKETFVQGNLFGEVAAQPVTLTHSLKTLYDFTYDYRVASTLEERKTLIEELNKATEFAFDTETTGLDLFSSQLVGLSFATAAFKAWYVPIPADQIEAKKIVFEFKEILENTEKTLIGQNIKFDLLMLKNYNIQLKGFLFDTMLAHYLVEPDLRHNLNYLSEHLLGYRPIEIEELIGKKGVNQISMRSVPLDKISIYASEDADLAFQLKQILHKRLVDEGLFDLYKNIEAPLIEVLADIERAGVKINSQDLNDYAKTLNLELIALDDSIKEMSGVSDLNISSPKQLGEVLFEKLKIASDVKMTKTKQYATGEDELLKYRENHPIIDKILDFRSLKKLLSTYIEALPLLVNPKTGRIHASFNQAVASTGRLSSNNPNLQNIPIRDEKGREIRKAFVPSSDEYVILSADYSQIELRLMAHMSKDASLLEAFQQGEDIHTATAAKIFKIPLNEVTREQRSRAKTANFGMIYGISAFGLSQRLSISRTEAKDLIDGYFGTYTGVKEYMDSCVRNAREKGWVATIFDRKRYLTDINSSNGTVRGLAERNAINAPIQGSAADVIKIAMIRIHNQLIQQKLKSKMIIQVHDELVLDVYKPEIEQVKDIVHREMVNAAQISVSLEVEVGVGDNWLAAH